ncbi:MAG: co-chaperone GroES [Opitutales bacterium]
MPTTTAKRTIRPLGDRVLLQRIEAETTTSGGIIIPDSAKEKPQEAKVLALGTGGRNDDGQPVPFQVKEGDRVLISKYGGTEIKLDDETYLLARESDLLGVLR